MALNDGVRRCRDALVEAFPGGGCGPRRGGRAARRVAGGGRVGADLPDPAQHRLQRRDRERCGPAQELCADHHAQRPRQAPAAAPAGHHQPERDAGLEHPGVAERAPLGARGHQPPGRERADRLDRALGPHALPAGQHRLQPRAAARRAGPDLDRARLPAADCLLVQGPPRPRLPRTLRARIYPCGGSSLPPRPPNVNPVPWCRRGLLPHGPPTSTPFPGAAEARSPRPTGPRPTGADSPGLDSPGPDAPGHPLGGPRTPPALGVPRTPPAAPQNRPVPTQAPRNVAPQGSGRPR
jgi:hypothetical protein